MPTLAMGTDLVFELLGSPGTLLISWSRQLNNLFDAAVEVAPKSANGLILVNVNDGLASWRLASYTFMYVHDKDLRYHDSPSGLAVAAMKIKQ